jgi:hypothetical protein
MKRIFFILFSTALILSACAPQAMEASPYYDEAQSRDSGGAQESFALPEAPAGAAEMDEQGSGNAAVVERVVLKNADVAIVVTDVEQRLKAIDAMANEMGGFVVSSNLYQAYTKNYLEVPEAAIVIRVPEASLDEAIRRIEADVVEVQNESRSGQDVTAEYVDLQSRLKNLEAAETQLTRILEEAQKTEDVLNVFNQLTSIREQIEMVKGQIKYYDESAALSSISVRIIAQETTQPIQIGPWTPQGAVSDAIQDLVYFWQDFVEFFIYFVLNFLPKLLLIALVYGLPLWLIVRGIRNAMRKRKARQAAVVEPKK